MFCATNFSVIGLLGIIKVGKYDEFLIEIANFVKNT
jgi:hypothetical protein